MWAQKFKDCLPPDKPEPSPNAHLNDRFQRVRVGHYMVPPELVEEYRQRLTAGVPGLHTDQGEKL